MTAPRVPDRDPRDVVVAEQPGRHHYRGQSPWWRPWRHYWLAPGPVYMLNDKPHRVTWWDEDHPDRKILDRRPLPPPRRRQRAPRA